MSRQVERFLDLLAERSLVSERTLAKLLRQVEDKKERGKSVPLDGLAKLLVDKGHLTQRQANSLVSEVSQSERSGGDEEFGLMPIDDEPTPRKVKARPPVEEEVGTAAADTGSYAEELTDAEVAALSKPTKKKRTQWGDEPTGGADAARNADIGSPLDELSTASTSLQDTPARRGKRAGPHSEWESPLLLVGGGGLLLLVLVGGLVWYLLRTDTGDAQLRAAREAYEDGAYAQAVENYERFLDAYSDHDAVSAARVQLGLARLRRALESGASFGVVLEQAQKMIAETEQEPAFREAGRELAAILPRVAEGLANEASQATSPEEAQALSAKTEEALALLTNTKYVPKSFRPTETMEDVRRTLASVERRRERQEALSAALAQIARAREEKSFQEAYRIYTDLVRSYADVADLPEVRAAIVEIAHAEVAELRFHEDSRPASTEDRESPTSGSILLTTPIQTGAAEGDAATAFVRIGGAVYGIDAATGEPRWRRYVGHDERIFPVSTPTGDALVVDVEHGELLRLEGRTGELVWRQGVGELIAGPVLHDERVLVPTSDSKLAVVNVESGDLLGFVPFAQPLAASPTIDADANRLAVVGERSIVYLLAADSLHGEDAVFVGHAAGTVSVPAAVLGDTLSVAENFAENRSRLHVLTLGGGQTSGENEAEVANDDSWQSRVEPLRLEGRVTTPMAVLQRRLAVVTDLGEVRVYDVPVGVEGPPISPVATRDASGEESLDHHLLLRESELWIAATRLVRLQILSTGGRLQARQLPRTYDGDSFVHPLVTVGGRLIYVRRPQDRAGHLVAAMNLDSGEPLWEHELAAPPTDVSVLPAGTNRRLVAAVGVATASGRLYAIEPIAGGTVDGRGGSEIIAADGIASLTTSAERIIVQGAGAEGSLQGTDWNGSQSKWSRLDVPGEIAARPVVVGGGLGVPLAIGQVFLVDAASGNPLAAPFQPLIRPERLPDWTRAHVVDPQRSFVIADRAERIYLLEVREDPARLESVAESPDLQGPVTGELCATPGTVFTAAADRLLIYRLPDLKEEDAIELDARIAWGPYRAGDAVLLATIDDRLHGFTHDGRKIAETSLTAPPAGRPTAVDGAAAVLVLEDGTLMQLDPRAGSLTAAGTFAEPIAMGPLELQGRIFAVTTDGVLVWRESGTSPAIAAVSPRP